LSKDNSFLRFWLSDIVGLTRTFFYREPDARFQSMNMSKGRLRFIRAESNFPYLDRNIHKKGREEHWIELMILNRRTARPMPQKKQ